MGLPFTFPPWKQIFLTDITTFGLHEIPADWNETPDAANPIVNFIECFGAGVDADIDSGGGVGGNGGGAGAYSRGNNCHLISFFTPGFFNYNIVDHLAYSDGQTTVGLSATTKLGNSMFARTGHAFHGGLWLAGDGDFGFRGGDGGTAAGGGTSPTCGGGAGGAPGGPNGAGANGGNGGDTGLNFPVGTVPADGAGGGAGGGADGGTAGTDGSPPQSLPAVGPSVGGIGGNGPGGTKGGNGGGQGNWGDATLNGQDGQQFDIFGDGVHFLSNGPGGGSSPNSQAPGFGQGAGGLGGNARGIGAGGAAGGTYRYTVFPVNHWVRNAGGIGGPSLIRLVWLPAIIEGAKPQNIPPSFLPFVAPVPFRPLVPGPRR